MARKTVGRRLFKQLPLADLDEADVSVIEAADADAIHESAEHMTVDEANVSATIGTARPSASDGPDDVIEQEAVEADEQGSFSDLIPEDAR